MRKPLRKLKQSHAFVVMGIFYKEDKDFRLPIGIFNSKKEAELQSRIYFKSNNIQTYVLAVPFGFTETPSLHPEE